MIRTMLKRVPGLRPAVKAVRARINPTPTDIIRRTFKGKKVFFVQVGSNDGLNGDPIYALARHDTRWSGILIEPVPYIFERLKHNYGHDPRFTFENVAISTFPGQQTFYAISPRAKEDMPGLPEWFDQLGSFNEDHVASVLDGRLMPYVEPQQVDCSTFGQMLARHHVEKLDLIHIDAEGSDWDVLSQIELGTLRPKLVLYEHKCLTNEGRILAERKMTDAGYRLRQIDGDTFAFRT